MHNNFADGAYLRKPYSKARAGMRRGALAGTRQSALNTWHERRGGEHL